MTDKKHPIESPLAQAMRQGTLGGKPKEDQLQIDNEVRREEAPRSETKAAIGQRKRLTAYLSPEMYTWTKVRAAQQDRELSDIVEEALQQYRANLQS